MIIGNNVNVQGIPIVLDPFSDAKGIIKLSFILFKNPKNQ